MDDIESTCGPVDILINNAGVSSRGSVVETSLEVDKRVMQVNYFGQLAMIKCKCASTSNLFVKFTFCVVKNNVLSLGFTRLVSFWIQNVT